MKKRQSTAHLILASASPRRAELMRDAGIPFEVVVSTQEEPEQKPAEIPLEIWPMCLAFMKATAVQQQVRRRRFKGGKPIILGADTIVVNGHHILNKARDRAHARRMLKSLQGKTHRVITGIALVQGDHVRLSAAEALCRIKRVSDAWLEKHLDSGLWQGKAGAYGIQDTRHDPFIQLVSGSFSTVVGLPIELVQSELASFTKE